MTLCSVPLFRRALLLTTLIFPALLSAQTDAPFDDGLNLRFANGIAAVVERKVITVDDIRREIAPLLPELQRRARNEQEFNQLLSSTQDDIIQSLIDRVLIVKEFRKDEKKRIPEQFVENQISETLITQFDGDRSKFLAYLRSRGMTMREYRIEVEEDIIYSYMRGQQRKSQSIISPVRVQTYYDENKDRFYQEDSVHMMMIQLNKESDESLIGLQNRAKAVVQQLRDGASFEDIAKEQSKGPKRARGGDWDWVKRSDLKADFSDPLFALNSGEVAEPVILSDSVYILKAADRKYAGVQDISDVRNEIENILLQTMARESQERWLERLRRNGYVKLY